MDTLQQTGDVVAGIDPYTIPANRIADPPIPAGYVHIGMQGVRLSAKARGSEVYVTGLAGHYPALSMFLPPASAMALADQLRDAAVAATTAAATPEVMSP